MEVNLKIDKWLGLRSDGAGDTNLRKGELALMQNFKITNGYNIAKRYGYSEKLTVPTGHATRGQWYGKIGSTYYHLMASDGHVYQVNADKSKTDLGTLTDAPTNFFYFGDAVYIQNGTEYKKWTGTGNISDVSGYVPIIMTATKPDGTNGTVLDGLNLLHNQRRQQFNGDGSSTDYFIIEQNLSSIDEVLVDNALKTAGTHYETPTATDLQLGRARWIAGNVPALGVNNVEIKYTNNSKTQYFNGTGSQTVFQLEETNITKVNKVYVGNVEQFTPKDFATTDVDVANNKIALASHGISHLTPIIFSSTGTLPSPLVAGTVYYLYNFISLGMYDNNGFNVSASASGTPFVDITSQGTGTHSVSSAYGVDLINGRIATITASVSGTNNVKVVYTSNSTNREDVAKYTNHNLYGGKNDNRVFLYGGSDTAIFSGLADGIPSAEYFPALNYIKVGRSNENIMQLMTQYDRQIIKKEDSIYYCSYEYDSTLGVSFPTYPLNDAIGCSYKGTGQLIENNPVFLHGKNVYTLVASNVRDERNTKYISERIQPLLNALTITNLVTFDNSADREYWIVTGKTCYIYNYGLDVWYYYYFADNVLSICNTANGVMLGTDTGQLMLMDTSLTDNGTTISALLETGWINYGLPNRTKFVNFMWADILPEVDSSADIYYATNKKGIKQIKKIDTLDVLNVDYADTDYTDVTYTTKYDPQGFRIKPKAKAFTSIKYYVRNNEDNQLTLLSITAPALVGGIAKG